MRVSNKTMEEPLEIRHSIENVYLYSYGGVSRFFREVVENQRLMGTKCKGCGKVWCPPRIFCSDCYGDAEWIELPPLGTVMAAIDVYYVPANYSLHQYLDLPYILALIKLDGADTCLYNVVFLPDVGVGRIKRGARVRAVFREKREGKLTDFYFVPLEDD